MAAAVLGGEVEEDFVEYYLFPRLSAIEDNKSTKEKLDELVELYTVSLSNYLFSYLWQNEPFRLTSVTDTSSPSIPPHLYGITRFGENVDDEWFIVFLLLQLTKSFPDLVVRVADNDGEFLLIEAAEFLDKWMNPETCEKRVYLYDGAVHILPLASTPALLTTIPSGIPAMADAVSAIRDFSGITKVDVKIQKCISTRTERYPDKIQEDRHRAHCYLPASAAAVLQARPSLLSSAVRAFYLRDSLDLKAIRAMKYFPPETRVMVEVVFTKCLYAQLMQQMFIPDKRVGWNLPATNSPQYKAYDLGMKLACGLEILAAQTEEMSGSDSDVEFDADVRWNRYLSSLKDKGYFRGEFEHSKLYDQLLETAKSYFSANLHQNGSQLNCLPGKEIRMVLNSMEFDVEELKEKAKNLSPPDDDSWLTLSSEQFDSMLSEHFSNGKLAENKNGSSHSVEEVASAVTDGLKSFVGHVSSYEGAEFPKIRNKKPAINKMNRVTFDPDSFADAMQSILDFKLPDWEDENRSSSSGMSDYSDEDGNDFDLTKSKDKKPAGFDSFANEMTSYMEEMDRELAASDVGQSLERSAPIKESDEVEDLEYKPVDLDLTALKNILESYSSQQGLPGPASNLLGSMGIQLPQDADNLGQ